MTLQPVCDKECAPACNPFSRVVVSYLVAGGTRVMWELRPDFYDPMPYTFQLQAGRTDNQLADDWQDVGGPVVNGYTAVDGERRLYGTRHWQFYRVLLNTPTGDYRSAPTGLDGTLSARDWRIAREFMRQEMVRMRRFAGQRGYLLKRRTTGDKCPVCLDTQTQEVRDPSCPTCFGTGYRCGYFFPMDCVWADMSPKTFSLKQDDSRGSLSVTGVRARMANIWMMNEMDIWVNAVTDERFYVHSIQHLAEVRGVPIIAAVEMRLAAYNDPVYAIDVPQQVQALS